MQKGKSQSARIQPGAAWGFSKQRCAPARGQPAPGEFSPGTPHPHPSHGKSPQASNQPPHCFFFRDAGNGRHLPGCSGLLEERGKLSKSGYFQNLSQSSSLGTSPLSPAGGVVVGWPHHPFGCAQHLAMPQKNRDPLGCSAQAPLSLHPCMGAWMRQAPR